MSNAELSREIAHLVDRALGGEAIDPVAAGESLARRFPHLFLSGELIGKAVARAASMVGVALTGAEWATSPPAYRASDAAFWYAQPGVTLASAKPGGPPRGWFAPPKPSALPAQNPEQILLASDAQQGAQAL